MKYALLFSLLVGCADIQDNTTLGDKAIIGTALTAIAIGASAIAE
jgi:hypothetical protein